jgi:AraC-like DNA-binding protein
LLYIISGEGSHVIDFKKYPISAGQFFLITPGQVHTLSLDLRTKGFIIFFTTAFYNMQVRDSNLITFPFFHSLNANPLVLLNDDQCKIIDFVIREMEREFVSDNPVDAKLLRSYLENILCKLSKNYPVEESFDFATSITFKIRKLEQYIENNFRIKREPRQYADMMNLSSSYLNTIVKHGLNKTLTDLISDRVILEAKRLFSYSDLTVSQVANRLNFSNSSYFIRFFRKQTGITPDQFKESINRAD